MPTGKAYLIVICDEETNAELEKRTDIRSR